MVYLKCGKEWLCMQCSFENCPGSLKHCSRAKSKNHNCVGQNVSVCVLRVTNTGQRGFEAQVTNLRSGMDLSKCVPIAIDVQLVCNERCVVWTLLWFLYERCCATGY